MARGQNLSIPAGSNVLIDTLSHEMKNSAAVLNPNDGVVYVRLNSRITDINPASWDWKLPSQSFGIFPGPWQSLGLYYLDQSGANRPGEVTVYDSDDKHDFPDIHSIGRSLQAQSTALDLVEGNLPSSPALGLLRLYADVTGHLGVIDSTGVGRSVLDAGTPAGGVLTGFYPNPGLATTVASTNVGPLGGSLSGWLPNPNIAPGSVGVSQLVANAATISAFASSSDGVAYTYSTPNVNAVVPALAQIALTTLGGPVLIAAMLLATHTVAGAMIDIYIIIDGVYFWFARGQVAVANMMVCISNTLLYNISAGTHTFALGWSTNTTGTITKGGWMSNISAIEHRR